VITIYWMRDATRRDPLGGDVMVATVGRLDLDILREEEVEYNAAVSTHHVDEGSPISDHARRNPRTLVLDVAHSESPNNLGVEGAEISDVELSTGRGAAVVQIPEASRVVDALEALDDLVGEEVDVEGLRRDVESWVITSVKAPRDVATAGALFATIALQEVVRAQTREVEAPSPRVERARRPRDRGQQNPRDTDTTETASSDPDNRTAAARVLDAVRSRDSEGLSGALPSLLGGGS